MLDITSATDNQNDPFKRQILTPSGLCFRLQNTFDQELGSIWLAAEISDFKTATSGHWYLSLKDQEAVIKAVVWKNRQSYFAAKPKEGWLVLVRGRLSLYAPRGDFQLIIDYLEPLGEGALKIAFEELKGKLKNEGLFDLSRKKKIPFWPQRVALITSPSGAVVMDFINVAQRRRPNLKLSIYGAKVQGFEAVNEIIEALKTLNENDDFDLIVLARGGGSLEDLWAFNNELLARAIVNSKIPVVSAIGHETDFTIADMVADLRAPTPSAAAEIIYRNQADLKEYLKQNTKRLALAINNKHLNILNKLKYLKSYLSFYPQKIKNLKNELIFLEEKLNKEFKSKLQQKELKLKQIKANLYLLNPNHKLNINQEKLNYLKQILTSLNKNKIKNYQNYINNLKEKLSLLSPLNTLQRGYALVKKENGILVKSSQEININELLTLHLAQGTVKVRVEGK